MCTYSIVDVELRNVWQKDCFKLWNLQNKKPENLIGRTGHWKGSNLNTSDAHSMFHRSCASINYDEQHAF